MKVLGIAGWSGSGKTTLVTRLLPELISRGYDVSTVKHAHHSFDIDQPGKDSFEHRRAGAHEVLISSAARWALMREVRDEPESELDTLLTRLSPVDLVLVEGFKRFGHDKIEVRRADNPNPPFFPDNPSVVAIASDRPIAEATVPVIDLDDIPAIADFVVGHCGLAERQP